jgi:hypothetical protein
MSRSMTGLRRPAGARTSGIPGMVASDINSMGTPLRGSEPQPASASARSSNTQCASQASGFSGVIEAPRPAAGDESSLRALLSVVRIS